MPDGTRVKVITNPDGTVTRKEMSKEEVAKMNKLQELKKKEGVTEKFKPPGMSGKVTKRMVDEFGNETFIEVDIGDCDMDNISM